MSLPNRHDRYESDKCLTGNSEKPDSAVEYCRKCQRKYAQQLKI